MGTFLLIGLGILAVLLVLRCWAACLAGRRGGLSRPDGGPDGRTPARHGTRLLRRRRPRLRRPRRRRLLLGAARRPRRRHGRELAVRPDVRPPRRHDLRRRRLPRDGPGAAPTAAMTPSSAPTTTAARAAPGTTRAPIPAAATGAAAVAIGAAAAATGAAVATAVAAATGEPRPVTSGRLHEDFHDRGGPRGRPVASIRRAAGPRRAFMSRYPTLREACGGSSTRAMPRRSSSPRRPTSAT